MNITLIRHGKSLWNEKKVITALEFKEWVKRYNDHGVLEEKTYPSDTLNQFNASEVIFTSDLKRAIESAKLLNPEVLVMPDPLFREVELPAPFFILCRLKLNANLWTVMFRMLWFCGYSYECESLQHAKRRAEKASKVLMECAHEKNKVTLVGHGFFNMMIGKELKKAGWNGARRTSSSHWGATTYTLAR
ncbi:phosphoglycerate mutase family protein [Jeotgalibacillus terrae]|uniref:Phosphoglycerate mutase family protein n=1 Tax=Jeotgalibacillus terrae TaxID=587735 RepID=A0ABW5ZI55_9BACL|nr:phosphoglycerate mutase family protein [Jeotgalibacillus terrae]MBM7578603.1 broad specificity phosphatase PhoE [Jeotgalibacillus terrae]